MGGPCVRSTQSVAWSHWYWMQRPFLPKSPAHSDRYEIRGGVVRESNVLHPDDRSIGDTDHDKRGGTQVPRDLGIDEQAAELAGATAESCGSHAVAGLGVAQEVAGGRGSAR